MVIKGCVGNETGAVNYYAVIIGVIYGFWINYYVAISSGAVLIMSIEACLTRLVINLDILNYLTGLLQLFISYCL